MSSDVTLGEIPSKYVAGPVQFAVLAPDGAAALPLCLLLMGAGGTRESLVDLQPVFEQWWAEKAVPEMLIATPTAGLDYYLEDPAGSIRWDSFLEGEFVPHLRAQWKAGATTLLAGISGGGYGALKLAFGTRMFAAVAAMQPMLEPGLHEDEVGARNRLHHSGVGPPQLVGSGRDPSIWESNNPANRARANADAIRESGLAIYIDAGDHDFLNAHDGAEFLHRTLWDLDLSHEYHLVRGADHGGPTMRPRLRSMFAWFGTVLGDAALDRTTEDAAAAWLQAGMKSRPPAGATTTREFLKFLRGRFDPLREAAAEKDPETRRRFKKF